MLKLLRRANHTTPPDMETTGDWQRIYSSQKVVHAEIVKGVLDQHGIAAVLLNKQDSNYLIGFYEVHVQARHRAQAEEIIRNEISFR